MKPVIRYAKRSHGAVSVAVWSGTSELSELPHEVFVILVAALECDSVEAETCGEEEVFCHRDTASYKVLVEAYAEDILVGSTEMTVTQSEITAGFLSIPFVSRIAVHRVPYL